MRRAVAAQGGYVFKTVGDAFCAAFHTAPEALAAVLEAQIALETESWPDATRIRVRMALHTGAVESRDADYFGPPLNRVARLLSTAHGGQTVLSQVTYDLVRDAPPAQASLRDLGEHRLKDLARPERVWQLVHPVLQAEFPPLRALDSVALPNNLPQQITRFIGRERELAALQETLASTPLVTLTGSGGSGKSRLSLQVAADTLDLYPDGAFLVELAPLAEGSLVASTVASVLGLKEASGQPVLTALTDHLKAKRLLLLLDNCEHVLDAAAKLADALVRQCPGVKVLATSREALGIAGEKTYRVPSLSLPDPKKPQTAESLSHFESVQLFIERAVQTQPAFAVTNENAPVLASVCFRLDGIPLAIEMAAARVRSLSVEDLNAKLDQRFRLLTGGSRTALPRQQTLRSLIDWSYDLLSPPEKALLRRLSVFAGGWTLEAAEAVCAGGELEDWEILDLLASLCDKSLAVAEPSGTTMRYRLLETVRQYARDRLLDTDEGEALRDRHLDSFLTFAEEIESQFATAKTRANFERFYAELDNLRAALDWASDSPGRNEPRLRLLVSTARFWSARGHRKEVLERLSTAMADSAAASPRVRAKGLEILGEAAAIHSDFAAARPLLEESLAIRKERGERLEVAATLESLGTMFSYQRDYASARRHFEESLAIQRESGNQRGAAIALNSLAENHLLQGELAAARPLYEESLAIHRTFEVPWSVCIGAVSLGELSFAEKDYDAAMAHWREALAVALENDYPFRIASVFKAVGGLCAVTGSPLTASRLWGRATRLLQEGDVSLPPPYRERLDAQIAVARAALNDDGAFDAAWQEGRAMSIEEVVAIARGELGTIGS